MQSQYTPEFLARFWSKVDCSAGLFECWPWTAGCTKQGYGCISWQGRDLRAHRVAYELANGHFSDELDVLHTCDNPPCVNPAHLFLGTALDNMRDMKLKGRDRKARGERNGRHKLTDVQVAEIRRLYAAGGTTKSALSRTFRVSPGCIGDLVDRNLRRTRR